MRKFLLTMLAAFLFLVVIPAPVLGVTFLVCFLAPINSWFGLLAILFIPAFALSTLIMFKIIDSNTAETIFWW